MKLIVAAMKEEVNAIKEHEVLVTGIGKVNAASKLTEALVKYDVKAIYNVGFAGASHHYHVGDIIVIEDASYHDFDLSLFGYDKGQVPDFPLEFKSDKNLVKEALKKLPEAKKGHLCTGDYFMTEAIDKPYIVDMEGTALYQVAYMKKTPIIAIKIISDIVGMDNNYENYKAFETEKGAIEIARIVNILLKE